ncbi:MAG: hypothetical protein GYB66_01810 [Chloroflexi bacterium]|nr:hypothetical protein [Chloroflexota bacterium]
MRSRQRVMLLMILALLLILGVFAFSTSLLPDPPIGPTATFPEGIDYPDERPVPRR